MYPPSLVVAATKEISTFNFQLVPKQACVSHWFTEKRQVNVSTSPSCSLPYSGGSPPPPRATALEGQQCGNGWFCPLHPNTTLLPRSPDPGLTGRSRRPPASATRRPGFQTSTPADSEDALQEGRMRIRPETNGANLPLTISPSGFPHAEHGFFLLDSTHYFSKV